MGYLVLTKALTASVTEAKEVASFRVTVRIVNYKTKIEAKITDIPTIGASSALFG